MCYNHFIQKMVNMVRVEANFNSEMIQVELEGLIFEDCGKAVDYLSVLWVKNNYNTVFDKEFSQSDFDIINVAFATKKDLEEE